MLRCINKVLTSMRIFEFFFFFNSKKERNDSKKKSEKNGCCAKHESEREKTMRYSTRAVRLF